MTDDEQRRKDVFAWFGAAAYHAQCFEVELQILLILTHRLEHPDATPDELEDFDVRLSRRTLGRLLRDLRERFTLHPDFDALLDGYRVKRNYLMHEYFFTNAKELLTAEGCGAMVTELRALADSLREADAIARALSKRMRRILGISEADVLALVRAELGKGAENCDGDA